MDTINRLTQQRDALLKAIVPLLDAYLEYVQDGCMESGMGEVTQEEVLSDSEPAKNASSVISRIREEIVETERSN